MMQLKIGMKFKIVERKNKVYTIRGFNKDETITNMVEIDGMVKIEEIHIFKTKDIERALTMSKSMELI